MVSRTAQGLLSLQARELCVWSLSVTPFSPRTADCRTGELWSDFDLSAVSLKLGDSDRMQQTERREEFVVVFTVSVTSSLLWADSNLRSAPPLPHSRFKTQKGPGSLSVQQNLSKTLNTLCQTHSLFLLFWPNRPLGLHGSASSQSM